MVPPGAATTPALAVSVHGPAGVLDLVAPAGATSRDLAREYAARAGLAAEPVLHAAVGTPLLPDTPLAAAGVTAGDLLVAVPAEVARLAPAVVPTGVAAPGPAGADLATRVACAVAASLGVLAGVAALLSGADAGDVRTLAAVLLVAAAVVGVLPLGRDAPGRALAAPAFGVAATLAVLGDPTPARLPLLLGAAALSGAVVAGVGRALTDAPDEGFRVWIAAGLLVFVTTGAAALLGLAPQVAWSVLLLMAVLATRSVPALAVDVPDHLLLDLDRLAVTAWSARERPRGRRGRAVASPTAVAAVAARGARLVTAASVAVALVALTAGTLLLRADLPALDATGARCQVLAAGAALLLAARTYRHVAARAALRAGGLGCWAALTGVLLLGAGPDALVTTGVLAVALGTLLVVVAVATGRGWRSAWWSRRAEVAEALAGAVTLAAVFVTSGLVRTVWELTSRVSP